MAGLEFKEEERRVTSFRVEAPAEPRLRLVRRRMAPVPLAWADRVRHAIFVGGIILMALAPGGLGEKTGVLGFALAYALSLASERRVSPEAIEETIDDEGVTLTVEGVTTRVNWSEIASYRVTPYGMGGIGLFGSEGRLRTILGRSLDEDGGTVTYALWNRMGRRIAARMRYGTSDDKGWLRYLRAVRWRTVAGAAGMALCLSPIFIRSIMRSSEDQLATYAFALFILVMAVVLFVGGFWISNRSEPTGDWPETANDEPILSAFLDARDGEFPPTAWEIGRRYRYLAASEVVGHIPMGALGLNHTLYLGLVQAGLLLRAEWVTALVFASSVIAFGGDAVRMNLRHRLSLGRDAEFRIEDGDLVVLTAKGEERYPLASARLVSLNRSWFDFGGEVEEYRNGHRRFYLDRRFLVPVEIESSRSDV